MKKHTSLSFSAIFMLSLLLVLTGCGPQAPQAPQERVVTTTLNEVVAVEAVESTEEAPSIEAEPEAVEPEALPDPALGLAAMAVPSVSEVSAEITNFGLKQEASFLQCAQSALQGCQGQTAMQVAQAKGSVEPCGMIKDEYQAQNCKNQLWQQLATLEKDVNLCDKIEDEFTASNCKNQYWRSLAQSTTDLDACENIADQQQLNECVNEVYTAQAREAKDVSLCANIKQYSMVWPEALVVTDVEVGEIPAPAEPEWVEVEDGDNYQRQNCEQQVEFAIQEAELAAAIENVEAPVDTAPIPETVTVPETDILPESVPPSPETENQES